MKKIVFLALALLVTGTMYADKKCCKDKSSCSKSASAKSCSKDGASATVMSADMQAAADAEGKSSSSCSKKTAGKACCSKGGSAAKVETANVAPVATPVRDDAATK
jgi:hypothetical protein